MSRERKKTEEKLWFVYDRVCTQDEKAREMRFAVGGETSSDNPSRDQPYRGAFAGMGRRLHEEARRGEDSAPSRPREGIASDEGRQKGSRPRVYAASSGDRTYQYRPQRPEGGEEAATRAFRGSSREAGDRRGEEELREIRRDAAHEKKMREYRRSLVTALIFAAVVILIGIAVYRTVFKTDKLTVEGSSLYADEEVLAASGIRTGVPLYSFRTSDAVSAVTFRLPWIRSVEISREVPGSVTLAVTEDTAVYRANIWGDTVVLSAGLRVLEVLPAGEAEGELVELILPPVDKSVAGRVLEFSNARSERYIRSVLSAVLESGLMKDGLVDRIDLSVEYEIRMRASGLYDLKFGSESEVGMKLKMAHGVITSGQLVEDIPAVLDLTEVDPVSVIYDFAAAETPGKP